MDSEKAYFEQPGSAEEHLDQASTYEENGQFKEALVECDAAVAEVQSFLADIFNLRGIVLEELECSAEARKAYAVALRLDPGFHEAAENLSKLESSVGISHNLITIATLSYPAQAHVLRTKLETQGIWAFVADENLVAMNWLYSNVIGGVKLQVKEQDVERALEILGIEPEDFEDVIDDFGEEEVEDERCPHCNSSNIHYEKYAIPAVFASWLLLSFPLPFLKRKWKCANCDYRWKM